MKNLWLVVVCAVAMMGLFACNGGSLGSANLEETAASAVPENSAMVVGVNLKSLMDKADMDAVKKMDFYKDMVAEAARQQGETMAKILENPEKSGIDLNENAYFFMNMESKDNGLIGFTFKIADEGDFEALVKESDMDATKGKGYQYATNNESVVAWNGSIGFVGALADKYGDDKGVGKMLDKVFNGSSSIADNSDAAKALGGNHDINYYFSSSSIVDMFGDELAMSEMFVSKEDLKNNKFSGYTDFKKGEIVSQGNSELSKGLKSDLKMLFGEGSETDFSKYLPGNDLVMLMTGKLNFAGVNQLLKDKGVNGMADMYMNSVGLTTDDIAKAIDGDMAVTMNAKKGSDEPAGVMTLKIGDRKALDEILNKGEAMGIFKKDGDNSYAIGGMGMPSAKMIIDGKVMIFSNDMAYISKMEKGGLSKSERVSKSTYKSANGVFGMYMDYANATEGFAGLTPMDMNTGGMETMQYSIGWSESSSKITMADKSKNALQVLIENMNDAYLESEKERKEWEAEWEADDVEM
ncbi:MAG: DUF4836 family protein [Saprospiraceae bacterium]